jgi:hypothetical protein
MEDPLTVRISPLPFAVNRDLAKSGCTRLQGAWFKNFLQTISELPANIRRNNGHIVELTAIFPYID